MLCYVLYYVVLCYVPVYSKFWVWEAVLCYIPYYVVSSYVALSIAHSGSGKLCYVMFLIMLCYVMFLSTAHSGSGKLSDDTSMLAEEDALRTFGHPWFPSRPSAVGNDGMSDQFAVPLFQTQTQSDSYSSAALSNESNTCEPESLPPPERSQPDGRDGSELKQRLLVNTIAVSSNKALPRRPHNDKLPVPLDKSLIKNGISSVQQQDIADHAESPVSQLLGPNFKAAQHVLHQLKQDRLITKLKEEETPSSFSSKDNLPSSTEASPSVTTPLEGVDSGAIATTYQHVEKTRPDDGYGDYRHSYPSSDEAASYTYAGVGAEILKDMEQRYGVSSVEDSGLKFGGSQRSSSNASSVEGPKEKSVTNSHSVEDVHSSQAPRYYSSSARASDASSNDTDDLLSYDAAMEGDLQYFAERRNFTRGSHQEKNHSFDDRTRPASRDTSESIKRSSDTLIQEIIDHRKKDDLTQYHRSLGAGVVTPLQDDSDTPVASDEHQSASQSNSTIRSLPKNSSSSQESLKVQDIEDVETDDPPSSTELYQPAIQTAGVKQTGSYGVYDIRRSSGPGSTNRRRRAMGLQPLTSRMGRHAQGNDTIYVSGGSTPVSIDGAKVMSVDSVTSASSTDRDRFENRHTPAEDSAELNRERLQIKPRHVLITPKPEPSQKQDDKVRYETDSGEQEDSPPSDAQVYQENGRVKDSLGANGSLASGMSKLQSSLPENSTERKQRRSSKTSGDVPHKGGWIPGFTPSTRKGVKDSAPSSFGARGSSTEIPHHRHRHASKKPARLQRTLSNTSQGYESDLQTSGTDSIASNISKLSQMIFRPLGERFSLSSQSSDATSVENVRRTKHGFSTVSSSSEVSGTSESLNSAFMKPKLCPSVEQQLKLRELLKNLGSRQAIAGVQPESTSEFSTEPEGVRVRVPSVRKEHQKRSSKEKPSRAKDKRVAAGNCVCGLPGAKSRTKQPDSRGRRNGEIYSGLHRTRDVAVNCSPDPELNIVEGGKMTEDASTQTGEVTGPVQTTNKPTQTQLRQESEADRRPVLLAPQQKDSVLGSSVFAKKDAVQSNSPTKERLIASENAPPLRSPAKHARKEGPVWFHPISNRHYSRPDSARLDQFQVDLRTAVQVPESLQKLTLQEAFMTAKPDFVQRSQARVSLVKEASKAPHKPCVGNIDEEKTTTTKSWKCHPSKLKVNQNCGMSSQDVSSL